MNVLTLVELQEKADVMIQLRALEREDRVHRQKSLAKMPVSIVKCSSLYVIVCSICIINYVCVQELTGS